MCASWTIQHGQRLTTRPERNFAHKEVTNYVKPKERLIADRNESEGIEPRNRFVALGQGFQSSEASISAGVKGESKETCRGQRPW